MRLFKQHRVPDNWALNSFGEENIRLALEFAESEILRTSLGDIIDVPGLTEAQYEIARNAVHSCEIAALDWWHSAKYPDNKNIDDVKKFTEICSIAFSILRSLPIPSNEEEKFSHILRVVSLGYLADRATDVKRWLSQRTNSEISLQIDGWNGLLANNILETWVRLVRRNSWEDVNQIANIIANLRKDQQQYEATFLNTLKGHEAASAAWQLIGFYHWAKATEVLAEYMLQGTPFDVAITIDFHFEKAFAAAEQSGSFEVGNLLRWLQLASHRLIRNSVWNVAKRFNSNISRYVERLVSSSKTTLELLPPQRSAIFEEGLLDRTHNAVVVSLPTSSGKTSLAIFRILEAINHFGEQKGWIAYTAPTRALVNQISARLRRELSPLSIKVERLSGAAEVDQFEEDLLSDYLAFDVLVCTPEKLDVVIRQKQVKRELVLFIMDEAHSLEEEQRGLKHELLLAMIRRDCPSAKFLLLTPFVSNGMEIARWLDPQAPGSISLSLNWQPNDRVLGKFMADKGPHPRKWLMKFETLASSHPSLGFEREVVVGEQGPLDENFSSVKSNLTSLACAMAASTYKRGTALVITKDKPAAWSAAEKLKAVVPPPKAVAPEVYSVCKFLNAEYGSDYELSKLLLQGIAVHHSGLSDEARFLVEWLTEESNIKVLCATTTIAQGINFPVSSILLSSVNYPYGNKMKFREFWNLVGRAGRLGQPGVGLIGIASREGSFGNDEETINNYLKEAHGDLLSSLLNLYKKVKEESKELNLQNLTHLPAWSAFLQYLAHLYNQSDRESLLGTQLELTLRDTFGFISLEKRDPLAARELVNAVRKYISYLSRHPENAKLAEDTGFAPDNAFLAMKRVRDEQINSRDWKPERLFGTSNNTLRKLMGVMLRVPELSRLRDIVGSGLDTNRLASLATDWVNGRNLEQLAKKYFGGTDTSSLTKCCDAIYGKLVNNATWGLASLQKLSGLDFEKMTDGERRSLNTIPAMIYYGVNTEEAVLMRMNAVPRSLAHQVSTEFVRQKGKQSKVTSRNAMEWLANLDASQWKRMLPNDYPMSGDECKFIWGKLSGVE